MERLLMHRRPFATAAVAAFVALAGLTTAQVAEAQQAGSRYRVLIPALEAHNGADARVGARVADELRKQISRLPTHTAVEDRDVREALRRYKLTERDLLDCIKARQLAVQMQAELVMCGSYEPAPGGLQMTATFTGARTGDSFEVPAFVESDHRAAATHIFSSFENFVNLTRLTAFGLDYLGSQQWDNALDHCRRALEISDQSIPASYCVARALLELEDLEGSLAMHRRVLDLNPIHTDALLTGGIVAARLDDQTTARDYFNQYLELNPGNVDVRLRVATDLARAGDPAGALRIAEEGLVDNPEHLALREFAGHYALAAAQRLAGQGGANGDAADATRMYEKALGYYREIFEKRGEETEATLLLRMMQTLNQLERHQEAVELGAQVVQVRRDNPAIWAIYADALQRVGRMDQAITALDEVAALDPEYANLYARRGLWLLQAGQVGRAREAFRAALQRNEISGDDVANMLFNYGYNERFRRGQEEAAIEFLDESRQFATSPELRARSTFFIGVAHFNRARRIQEASTPASARQSLPIFQTALQHFEQSRAYREQERAVAQFIEQSKTFIEIQEALIRRGR
jgi:tetratricopeptide (TPR) repeat protein